MTNCEVTPSGAQQMAESAKAWAASEAGRQSLEDSAREAERVVEEMFGKRCNCPWCRG